MFWMIFIILAYWNLKIAVQTSRVYFFFLINNKSSVREYPNFDSVKKSTAKKTAMKNLIYNCLCNENDAILQQFWANNF